MEQDPDTAIIRRELDTGADNPAVEVAQAVADIEETEATELADMYSCVDGMLDELFSTPPAEEAQMEVEFSYHDYRIRIEQDGSAEFIKTETP